MTDDELQRLLSDDYLVGLEERDAAELRTMRAECEAQEHRISYARRILQGRVDVLRAEAEQRSGGAARGVLDRLTDVLADRGERRFDPATSRPPSPLDPAELGDAVAVEGPTDPSGLDDQQLQELADGYAAQEAELSRVRRQLFDVIDRLQAEIADRYRTGAASVSDLLTNGTD